MQKHSAAFFAAFVILAVPSIALAAPFGLPNSIIPPECQACPAAWGCLLKTFDNIVAFALAFAIVIATILFAYAGFLWVLSPASSENIKKGKSILWHTVIGLVITFGAWLIVNTVLSTLTKYTVDSATSVFGGGTQTMCLPGANPREVTGTTATKEEAVRQQLLAGGVIVNKSACPENTSYKVVPGGCTSVANMRPATVAQVIALKRMTGLGSVVVTGGSEQGHASGQYSHANGYKVDLRLGNSALDLLLKSLQKAGTRGGDTGAAELYKDRCGNIYALEETHWDIQVLTVCDPLK